MHLFLIAFLYNCFDKWYKLDIYATFTVYNEVRNWAKWNAYKSQSLS